MIWHITNLLLNKNIISDVGLKPSQSLAVPGREHDRFHPAPSGAMVTPDRLLKERQPASRPVQLTCGCKPVYRGGNKTTAEAISRPRLPVMTISRCASIVLSTPSALFLISPALQSIACKTNSTAKPSGARRSTSSTLPARIRVTTMACPLPLIGGDLPISCGRATPPVHPASGTD